MKNTDFHEPHATLYIQSGGFRLKVFRVGSSPRIGNAQSPVADFRVMKGIHTHFTYEVFFVVSGTLQLVTEHFTKEYRDTLLIIPPQLKHFSIPGHSESYCLLFSFEDDAASAEFLNNHLDEGILALPMADDIAFYIRKLTEKTAEASGAAEADAEHLAALIFSSILSKLRPDPAGTGKNRDAARQHISAIEAFINRNISKKLTLSDLSANVFLSTKQVARIIEREYGYTFSQLITDKRLAIAAILLKNTDMRVCDIASQTFYGTESYFYTLFKNKYGMSPLQYRKEIRLYEM